MEYLIVCFGVILAVINSGSCQYRFDYTYNVKAGGWLKLHVMPLNFHEAFKRCQAEGAVLASPINAYLRNAMIALHKRANNENFAMYTGIHATIAKGAFISIEGVPLSRIHTVWAPDEPDNHNDSEDCIVMLQNGTMADVRCTETFPFVCFKKKTKNLVINDCGTVDNDYVMDSRTGSCYKLHKVGRSWRNAYMTCIAEGGHLAIINNAVEAQVIKDVFARVDAKDIFAKSIFKNIASIGFYDWSEWGVFYDVHGEPIQDGYQAVWGKGPDNGKNVDGEFVCGSVSRGALYYDIWCNADIPPFICEKKPDSLLADEEY